VKNSSQLIFQFKQLERRSLKKSCDVRCSTNWYRGGHGFESRWSPDFFRLLLSNCLNWKINCDDHFSLSSTTTVHIWIISYKLHITIDTSILIKNNKKLCSYIRAIFYINCDYNFNPWGIFESMTSFTQILNQGKSMVAV